MELPHGTVIVILRRFGISCKSYKNTFKVKCPFHEDTHPSASVNPERNTFLCFVCQDKLYKKWQEISETKGTPKKALPAKALFRLLGGTKEEWKQFVKEIYQQKENKELKLPEKKPQTKEQEKPINLNNIWNGLLSKDDESVKKYLLSRKIDYDFLVKENIIKIINTQIHKSYKNYPITIPLFNTNQELIGIQLRTHKPNTHPKTIMIRGSNLGYFGLNRYDSYYPITFFVEGSSDFLTLVSWRFKNVIGIASTSMDISPEIASYAPKIAFVFYDFDETGIRLFKKIKNTILKENPKCIVIPVGFDLRYKMDLNDFARLYNNAPCELVDILNNKLKVYKNENEELINKGVLVW